MCAFSVENKREKTIAAPASITSRGLAAEEFQENQKTGKSPLWFCSGKEGEKYRTLVERGIISVSGQLNDDLQFLKLPALTDVERKSFKEMIFPIKSLPKVLGELAAPKRAYESKTITITIKTMACVGSSVPYVFFRSAFKEEEGKYVPYLKRCLEVLQCEDLYDPDLMHPEKDRPSDIDIRASVTASRPLSPLQRNSYYQEVRSALDPRGNFRPPVDDAKSQFANIPIKLRGIKEKMDFIVCFDTKRKCVFTVDALICSFEVKDKVCHISSAALESLDKVPLQAIIDHLLGLVRIANTGGATVDKRGWLRLISCMVKGKVSAVKGQERLLWECTQEGYQLDTKKGRNIFMQGIGHWLHTHHFGDPSASFLYMLSAFSFIQNRWNKDQLTSFFQAARKWHRIKNFCKAKKAGFLHELARLFFVSKVPPKYLYAMLQVLAYLVDSKKQKKESLFQVSRFFHEVDTPFYKLHFGRKVLQLPATVDHALTLLSSVSSDEVLLIKELCNKLSVDIFQLFPLGVFWKMRSLQKTHLQGTFDLKEIEKRAWKLLKTSKDPLLAYLALLTLFATSSTLKTQDKGELLFSELKTLYALVSKQVSFSPFFATISTMLAKSVDQKVFESHLKDKNETTWIYFLASQKGKNVDLQKVAFYKWKKSVGDLTQEEALLSALKLLQAFAERDSLFALKVLAKIAKTPLPSDLLPRVLDALFESALCTEIEMLLLAFGRLASDYLTQKVIPSIDIQEEMVIALVDPLIQIDPARAVSLLLYIPLQNSKKVAETWLQVLGSLHKEKDAVTLLSWYQTYVAPFKECCSQDKMLDFLISLSTTPLTQVITQEILALKELDEKGKKKKQTHLFSELKKDIKTLSSDNVLIGELEPKKQWKIKESIAFSLLERKKYVQGCNLLLELLKEEITPHKLARSFKKALLEGPLDLGLKLLKRALEEKKLMQKEAFPFFLHLVTKDLQQVVHDIDLFTFFFQFLNEYSFEKISKKYVSNIFDIVLQLLEKHSLLEGTWLYSQKNLLQNLVPLFFTNITHKQKGRLALAIYRNGLTISATSGGALFWLQAINAINVDAHTLYALLGLANKWRLCQVKEMASFFVLTKVSIVKRWSAEKSSQSLALVLLEEILPEAKTGFQTDIELALECVLDALEKQKKYARQIALIVKWQNYAQNISPLLIRKAVKVLEKLSDSSSLPDHLLTARSLFVLPIKQASMVKELVEKGLAIIVEKQAVPHVPLHSLLLSYLSYLIPQEKAAYSEKKQQLFVDVIKNLYKRDHIAQLLSLLEQPLFFEAFTIEKCRIEVISLVIEKILDLPQKKQDRMNSYEKIGALLDREIKRVGITYDTLARVQQGRIFDDSLSQQTIPSIRRNFAMSHLPVDYDVFLKQLRTGELELAPENEKELIPLFIAEIHYLRALIQNAPLNEKSRERLKIWVEKPKSGQVWEATAPLICALLDCKPFSNKDQYLLAILTGVSHFTIQDIPMKRIMQEAIKQQQLSWLCITVSIFNQKIRSFKLEEFESVLEEVEKIFEALLRCKNPVAFKFAGALISNFEEVSSQFVGKSFSIRHLINMLTMYYVSFSPTEKEHAELRGALQAMRKMLNGYIGRPERDGFLNLYFHLVARLPQAGVMYLTDFFHESRALWSHLGFVMNDQNGIEIEQQAKKQAEKKSRMYKKKLLEVCLDELNPAVSHASQILDHLAFFIAIFIFEFHLTKKSIKDLIAKFKIKSIKANCLSSFKSLNQLIEKGDLILSFQMLPRRNGVIDISARTREMKKLFTSNSNFDFHLGVNVFKFSEETLLFSGIDTYLRFYRLLLDNMFRKYEDPCQNSLILLKINISVLSCWGHDASLMPATFHTFVPYLRVRFFQKILARICDISIDEMSVKTRPLIGTKVLTSVAKDAEKSSLVFVLVDIIKRDLKEKTFITCPMLALYEIYVILPVLARLSLIPELKDKVKDSSIPHLIDLFKKNYTHKQQKDVEMLESPKDVELYTKALLAYWSDSTSEKSLKIIHAKEQTAVISSLVQFAFENLQTMKKVINILEKKKSKVFFNC